MFLQSSCKALIYTKVFNHGKRVKKETSSNNTDFISVMILCSKLLATYINYSGLRKEKKKGIHSDIPVFLVNLGVVWPLPDRGIEGESFIEIAGFRSAQAVEEESD